jgi:xylulokinase
MMGAIGTGNYREGIVTVSLGTSGTAYSYMTKPYVDPEGEIASFCDATGNYLPLLCISNLANGYEAILKQYNLTHEQFIDVIGKTPPGNNGRMLCPWYEGERTPDLPEAAPIYFGWGLGDFSQEYLCRAVMEGHIMNLYEGFLKLPIKAKEIRITGGISKSQAWRQTIADIFECDVVAVLGEGAAMGAALHAAWSYYKSKSLPEIADSFVVLDQANRVKPNSENIMIYRKFKAQYLAVSQRIRGKTGDNPFKIHKSLV